MVPAAIGIPIGTEDPGTMTTSPMTPEREIEEGADKEMTRVETSPGSMMLIKIDHNREFHQVPRVLVLRDLLQMPVLLAGARQPSQTIRRQFLQRVKIASDDEVMNDYS